MKKPVELVKEISGIETLKAYSILDTLPEQDFDDIVFLVSQLCDVPMALVSLVDEKRQWFKSKQGLEVNETPLNIPFCSHAIRTPSEIFEVYDKALDQRLFNKPEVIEQPGKCWFMLNESISNPDDIV